MCAFTTCRWLFTIGFAMVGSVVFAQSHEETMLSVNAQLVPVGQATPQITNAPLYSVTPHAGDVKTDGSYPHAGSLVNFTGGPDVEITQVDIYLYSTAVQAVNSIRYQLKFWESYNGTADPIFNSGVADVVDIDLVGPYSLNANVGYMATVVLPKSILIEGFQSKGMSINVQGNYGDGNYVSSSLLVPTLSNSTPSAGSHAHDFGAQALDSDDPNFDNFSTSDTITPAPAITLYGNPLRSSNCSAWNGKYGDFTVEEFDSTYDQRWGLSSNGGSLDVSNGIVTMTAPSSGSTSFPYGLQLVPTLPTSGQFSVRWEMKYKSTGPGGDGIAIGTRSPINGGTDTGGIVAQGWQDTANGYRVAALVGSNTTEDYTYQENAGTALHAVEYCWLTNIVEVWVDGAMKYQEPRAANVPRPAYIWFGNPGMAAGGTVWNNFELHRIHVRTPVVDTIFTDGFDSSD